MHASTPERFTGPIELHARLADEDAAAAELVTRRVSSWVRAIEIGCFGTGRVHVEAMQVQGNEVWAELRCEWLSAGAVDGLERLLQHLSATQARFDDVDLSHNGRPVAPKSEVILPDLPGSIPFAVEYPEDLTPFVRVEIEFRAALSPAARDAVFEALAVWDLLVAAFGEAQRWGDRVDLETRLLNPRMVEHQVDGYFASFECLHLLVLLALRLHQRLAIERLTLE